jgi:hypothetical protein
MAQIIRVTWLYENLLSWLHKYSIAGSYGGDLDLHLAEVDVGEANTVEHDL